MSEDEIVRLTPRQKEIYTNLLNDPYYSSPLYARRGGIRLTASEKSHYLDLLRSPNPTTGERPSYTVTELRKMSDQALEALTPDARQRAIVTVAENTKLKPKDKKELLLRLSHTYKPSEARKKDLERYARAVSNAVIAELSETGGRKILDYTVSFSDMYKTEEGRRQLEDIARQVAVIAAKELGLRQVPTVEVVSGHIDSHKSFGSYDKDENKLRLSVEAHKTSNLSEWIATVFHEVYHAKNYADAEAGVPEAELFAAWSNWVDSKAYDLFSNGPDHEEINYAESVLKRRLSNYKPAS